MISSQLSKEGDFVNIGSRIYYEKTTGNVILRTPEVLGGRQSTVEEDFVSFSELNQRVPETIGMIQFEYKQYEQDFAISIPTQVVNGEVLWTLMDVPDGVEPVLQKPLTSQVQELKQYTQQLNNDLMSLSDYVVTLQPL